MVFAFMLSYVPYVVDWVNLVLMQFALNGSLETSGLADYGDLIKGLHLMYTLVSGAKLLLLCVYMVRVVGGRRVTLWNGLVYLLFFVSQR